MKRSLLPFPTDISPWETGFLGLVVFTAIVFGLIAVILFLAGRLGLRKPSPVKDSPYESGVIPTGSARIRYPVPFYLVAAFFLVFDVEVAFIFSWAVAFEELGWEGWVQISVFILVLLVSLFYLWAKGGLDWGPSPRKERTTSTTSS